MKVRERDRERIERRGKEEKRSKGKHGFWPVSSARILSSQWVRGSIGRIHVL